LLLATAIGLPCLQWLSLRKQIYPTAFAALFTCVLLLTVHHQAKTVAYYLDHQTEAAYSVFSLQGGIATGGTQYRHPYPANAFWVAPMPFPEFPVEQTKLGNQLIYTTPGGIEGLALCGRAFPCAPYFRYFQKTLPLTLQLRGETLRDGFRMGANR
jgi:hypothetical protein